MSFTCLLVFISRQLIFFFFAVVEHDIQADVIIQDVSEFLKVVLFEDFYCDLL